MGVTMTQRYRDDVTSLRRQVRSGEYGDVDTIYSRYAVNARSYGTWKPERLYDVANHPMLVEGAIHHLDLLADLAGDRVDRVFCNAWNPPYSEFAGDPNAHVHLVMANGTSVSYEASNTSAATFNGWGDEHVRVDCAEATLLLDGHELRAFPYDAADEDFLGNARVEDGELLALAEGEKWGNTWLVERFAEWCEGGEPMETNARDNLQSMATVFAAIESDETGKAVDVQAMLADAEAIAADS
jgi:predicted dehydrogenase